MIIIPAWLVLLFCLGLICWVDPFWRGVVRFLLSAVSFLLGTAAIGFIGLCCWAWLSSCVPQKPSEGGPLISLTQLVNRCCKKGFGRDQIQTQETRTLSK
jgi:hypothetical protein